MKPALFPRLIVSFGLLLLTSTAFSEPTLVDRVLAAHGESWATTHAMEQQGVTFSKQKNTEGPVTRLWQFPEQMRVDIRYSEQSGEQRILNGSEAWQHGQPANPILHGAIRLQAARLALPRLLHEQRARVTATGTTKGSDGKPWQLLHLPLEDGLEVIVSVDADYRIRQSEGILRMGDSEVSFATVYEDYRKVDDRLIAFKEIHFAMGNQNGHTQLERVSFPAQIGAERFKP